MFLLVKNHSENSKEVNRTGNRYLLIKYFLISYVLIWTIAMPMILLALFFYGIPFTTDYETLMRGLPLPLAVLIICVSAFPSYYLPANLYFKKIQRKITIQLALKTASVFWGLSMLLDGVFVVIIAGVNILAYPFNWIYLGVSPVMIISVYLAGIRNIRDTFRGEQHGQDGRYR